MESVRWARAMGRRIGQWIDDLQLLDDRAGPPVQDDERQRILMLRTNVDEMNVEAVDLGDEVREGLQPLLALAPVVLFRPVARERLHRRQPPGPATDLRRSPFRASASRESVRGGLRVRLPARRR